MESLQNIKRRSRSIGNIGQIAKAMELVAATKMRRSQELALASRPYAFTALAMLADISAAVNLQNLHIPLLARRPVKKTLFIMMTSDKGLAGSFNAAVFREFEKFVAKENIFSSESAWLFAAVGQKADSYLTKRNIRVVKKFIRFGDFAVPEETKELSDFITAGYVNEEWDRVLMLSTNFKTALNQKVVLQQILPFDAEAIRKTAEEIVPRYGRYSEQNLGKNVFFLAEKKREYIIEPSPELALEALLYHLIDMEIYHIVLEANASEHAARRAAMKNASDNAAKLTNALVLAYNKLRQGVITQEIMEITAGAEAAGGRQ